MCVHIKSKSPYIPQFDPGLFPWTGPNDTKKMKLVKPMFSGCPLCGFHWSIEGVVVLSYITPHFRPKQNANG